MKEKERYWTSTGLTPQSGKRREKRKGTRKKGPRTGSGQSVQTSLSLSGGMGAQQRKGKEAHGNKSTKNNPATCGPGLHLEKKERKYDVVETATKRVVWRKEKD